MKELFEKVAKWLSENKDVVIKGAAGVVGAIAGILVSSLLQEGLAEQEGDLPEWMLEDDDTVEDDENGEEI